MQNKVEGMLLYIMMILLHAYNSVLAQGEEGQSAIPLVEQFTGVGIKVCSSYPVYLSSAVEYRGVCTGTESRTGMRTLYRIVVPVYRAVAEVSLVDTFPSPPPPSLSLAPLSCFKVALLERNQTDQSGGEIGDHESHDKLITVSFF